MNDLSPRKFLDPDHTATGEERAWVSMGRLRTLWFNTGTLCNLACPHCYIESSPRNDRLAYLTAAEAAGYLDEIEREGLGTEVIGFTGGEPFLNRELEAMLGKALERGFRVLVLTNAMKPMVRAQRWLLGLRRGHGDRLGLRVSLDHYAAPVHDGERGPGSWDAALAGLRWLHGAGFPISIATRRLSGEDEAAMRAGFARLFASLGLALDADDPEMLVVFPEMDGDADVPEITTRCWGLLGRSPESLMCAGSRMVVKRKGAAAPVVVACTLIPYDRRFEMGRSLVEAAAPVSLSHPHCARFCVLGGGSCARG